MQTIKAARDNSSVAGKRFSTIARTGAAKRSEVPPIAAREPLEISRVLHAERLVQSERMAQLRKIFGARVLSEHLQHRVAWNDMNQQKNHGQNEPQRRQRVEEPHHDVSDHSVFRAFSAMGFVSGEDAGSAGSPGCFKR